MEANRPKRSQYFMVAQRDYDVIVVGAGNAAMTAALSAREAGASVLVLEKAPQSSRGSTMWLAYCQ